MRLLNVRTLELEEFFNSPLTLPKYAILSHTWGSDEVTLTHMLNGTAAGKRGFDKIRCAAEQALEDGYSYLWVDTCNIDKSSSAELSEAINSMFEWYRRAGVCYAYLEGISKTDIPRYDPSDEEEILADGSAVEHTAFGQHRWFQRGWTLQELIAPPRVEFYGENWEYLGSSLVLLDAIVSITKIDERILSADPKWKMEYLYESSIAQRMSWAANRSTTRPEDEAYCLLGLFGVSMPMLYGEGSAAFIRLQEEIMKKSSDQTIFGWHSREGHDITDRTLLLAPNAACFRDCATLHTLSLDGSLDPYSLTNAGLNIAVHLISAKETWKSDCLALLSCRYQGEPNGLVGLWLTAARSHGQIPTYYVDWPDRYEYKSRGAVRKTVKVSWRTMKEVQSPKTIIQILRRRPPRSHGGPARRDEVTTFFVDDTFGFFQEHTLFEFNMRMSIKSLYPAKHWTKTPIEKADMLLLPESINTGAIRVRYRNTSFIVSFGLERKNWQREASVAWIDIQDTAGDLSLHDVVQMKEAHYREKGFATKRIGKDKVSLTPRQFPDDLLEVSLSRDIMLRDVVFMIYGAARKLTVPALTNTTPEWEIESILLGKSETDLPRYQIDWVEPSLRGRHSNSNKQPKPVQPQPVQPQPDYFDRVVNRARKIIRD